MKNLGNIIKYPILLALFIGLMAGLDALFGKSLEGRFWRYLVDGGAFLLALLIADLAERHGWDTWSGLFSKFKKDK